MTQILLVALGGAVGASLRFLSGLAAVRLLGAAFPYGTLFVNIVGSFAMGVLIAWLVKRGIESDNIKLFLATGLLGGFTTFSAFSLDFVSLWQRGDTSSALVYVLASVIISLIAIFIGLWLGKSLA